MNTDKVKAEAKQVPMGAEQQPLPAAVYKFTPEAYAKLGEYLLKRPMIEARGIYAAFFKHGQVDPYYKKEAVDALTEYLLSCPMGEVEPIVAMLEKGGLLEFRPQIEPKKEERQTEEPAAETKS